MASLAKEAKQYWALAYMANKRKDQKAIEGLQNLAYASDHVQIKKRCVAIIQNADECRVSQK